MTTKNVRVVRCPYVGRNGIVRNTGVCREGFFCLRTIRPDSKCNGHCSQTAVVESWPVTSVEVSLYFTIELTYRFLDIFRIHLQLWQMRGYTVWAGPCKNRPPKRGLSHLLS